MAASHAQFDGHSEHKVMGKRAANLGNKRLLFENLPALEFAIRRFKFFGMENSDVSFPKIGSTSVSNAFQVVSRAM
jgi:hypothetical protein